MRNHRVFWGSLITVFACLFVIVESSAEQSVTIKSVRRLPRDKYIFSQYEEMIGNRYNSKFYASPDSNDIIFFVRVSNPDAKAFKVHLFFKSDRSRDLMEKIVDVSAPSGKKETVKIPMSYAELQEKGYPDFWWVEVRDAATGQVLDERGLKNFREIRQRLLLMQSGFEKKEVKDADASE
jgi:hypothetical protein